jgi:capsular polysaccharide biosynthesis protein
LELRRYLTVLRSRLWLILATTLLAASAGYTFAASEPEYVARSTLYVGSTIVGFDPTEGDLSNDRLAAFDRIVLTFSKMIDTEPIARQALEQTDVRRSPSQVVRSTEATPEPATQLLYIDVRDKEPRVAQALANGLASSFVEAVREYEPTGGEGVLPQLPAYVFERAGLPTQPLPTEQLQSLLLGALFGLIAGAGIAFLLDYLDLSLRTAADVERHLDLPVLGTIPSMGDTVPLGGWAPVQPGKRRRKG